MDPRTAATPAQHPEAAEFVRFCYRRRRVGWPELYDEMCAVAARGLFRGYGADDLAGLGIGFSLFDMPALAVLVRRIVDEELALRRPVAVVITAAPEDEDAADQVAAAVPAAPIAAASIAAEPIPAEPVAPRPETPIRFVPVPAGA